MLAAALAAYDAGLSVFPPKQNGGKRPYAAWATYQTTRATVNQITAWYSGGRTGLGVVMGRVSGNRDAAGKPLNGLELFDFDDRPTYDDFCTAAVAGGLADIVASIRAGYEEDTPNGGVHWLYRSERVSGNTKLARRPLRLNEVGKPGDKVKVLIETRGERGYAVLAPSHGTVHRNGPYVLRSGSFAIIATIAEPERTALWQLARTFDQMPVGRVAEPPSPKPLTGDRPGDVFNARADWASILEPHGWQRTFSVGGKDFWRRPGKADGWSATTNHADSGLLYVFSTSTTFEAERGYSPFSAYTLLNHDGDFEAAARELRRHGYVTASALAPPARAHAEAPIKHSGQGDADDRGGDPPEPMDAPAGTEAPHLTDLGNAQRLVRRFGSVIRYCGALGGWMAWDGRRWKLDTSGVVERYAKRIALDLYHEASDIADGQVREAFLRHCKASNSARGVAAMLRLAQSEPGVPAESDAFDRDPYLLCVQNGTLDLRTGELRAHRTEVNSEPG